MSNTNDVRLFRYMSQQFNSVNARLDSMATKADLDSVVTAIDGLYGLYDKVDTEIAAVHSHTLRIDDALQEIRRQMSPSS